MADVPARTRTPLELALVRLQEVVTAARLPLPSDDAGAGLVQAPPVV